MVIGYLNTDIGRCENLHCHQVSDFLAYFSLVDLLSHFRQRLHFRHIKTWWQV